MNERCQSQMKVKSALEIYSYMESKGSSSREVGPKDCYGNFSPLIVFEPSCFHTALQVYHSGDIQTRTNLFSDAGNILR